MASINLSSKRSEWVSLGLPLGLFIISERAFTVTRGDAASLSERLLAALASFILIPLIAYAANAVFGDKGMTDSGSALGKSLFFLFSILTMASAFYISARTAHGFSAFAADVMFLKIPETAVTAIFLIFCAYLSFCGPSVQGKFAFVSSAFILLSAALLFLMSLPHFSADNAISAVKSMDAPHLEGILAFFAEVFAPTAIAVVFISAAKGKARPLGVLFGLIFGCVTVLICFFNTLLIMGGELSPLWNHPYVMAVSTVTAGKLFARMEGLAYMMYFAAAAVKASVCISVTAILAGKMLPKDISRSPVSRLFPVFASVAVFVISLVI